MAETLEDLGLRIVSGGTDNHLMLVDLRPWNRTGATAESALGQVGITVNKNMIPFDPVPPTIASGIRIGTAAVTARGFAKEDIERVAVMIGSVLREKENFDPAPYRAEVFALCRDNPLYLAPLEFGTATTPKTEN